MMNKSNAKGKRGERRFAKLLADFTGKSFRRSPSSGGFNKQGVVIAEQTFSGDILCDDIGFLFSAECKNRPHDFSLPQILSSPNKAPFTYWWHQTITDAKDVDLFPILFFKAAPSSNATVSADHIAIPKYIIDKLGYPDDAPKFCIDVYKNPLDLSLEEIENRKKVKVIRSVQLPTPYIINWKSFIKHVDPSKMFNG